MPHQQKVFDNAVGVDEDMSLRDVVDKQGSPGVVGSK